MICGCGHTSSVRMLRYFSPVHTTWEGRIRVRVFVYGNTSYF